MGIIANMKNGRLNGGKWVTRYAPTLSDPDKAFIRQADEIQTYGFRNIYFQRQI